MAIGTPYLVGSNAIGTGTTTVTITVSHATAAGDAIVVSGGTFMGSPAPTGCTDTQNNTYQLTASSPNGTYQFTCLNGNALTLTGNGGAADVITVTYSLTTAIKNVVAIGCSGVASTSALDQLNTGASVSTSWAQPSLSTSAQISSNDLAVAVITNVNAGGTITWAGGWTAQATAHTSGNTYTSIATQVLTSAAAVTASGTLGGTNPRWDMVIITLSATPILSYSGASAATVGFCASSTGAPGRQANVSATIDFSASANQGISIVNAWTAKALNSYGLQPVPVSNNPNNALICFVGWNAAAVNPVSNVADDAHNWWQHLGTSPASASLPAGAPVSRCAIWIAPKAQAVRCVSVGLSWFAQGVTVIIAEVAGLPAWASIDVAVSGLVNANTLSLPYTTTGSDVVFAATCQADNGPVLTRPPGWAPITKVKINDPGGVSGPMDCGLTASWRTNQAGAQTSAWNLSGTATISGVVAAISLNPAAPVQKNPNWPGLHVEAAFGYSPGDPTQMPVWTDITSRLIGETGQASIQSNRGRQYESQAPEAGDLTIHLDNHDGALTPGNSSSPWYPNVKLGMPVRVWGTWNNRTYAIASGHTERLPQTWPDAQYGQTPLEAPNALDVLANSTLPSAFAGELLSDSPYLYIPCGDTYLQNGASGLPLANKSRTNQRPMTCMDAIYTQPNGFLSTRHLQTGLSWQTQTVGQVANLLGLPGDNSTAIGVTVQQDQAAGIAVTPEAGAFYKAPDMPQPSNGLTVEFWAQVDSTLKDQSHFIELLRFGGAPGNYFLNFNRGSRMLIRCDPALLVFDFMDNVGGDFVTSYPATITDGKPHHIAATVTLNPGGTSYKVQPYLDGQALASFTTSNVTPLNDWDFLGIGGVIHDDGGVSYGYNYTIGHVAVFPSLLRASRIQAHYNTASAASAGDDSVTRMAKLLVWGGLGVPRAAAPASPSPQFGPADQVAGQTVVDAGSVVATSDGGLLFADAADNVTWWPRTFIMNRPVKWVFGDNPANGEIPFDPGEQYGYDNTFINNQIATTRQISASNNGTTAVAADQASQQQYFVRGSLQQNIETTSDQDAYDQANWNLAKYKQPAIRVEQVVIDPASNPSIWPAALGIEQGDVVQLIRRPLGGATINQTCIVEMVSHEIGPSLWKTTINMIPYDIESTVLQCDAPGSNVIGNNGIGW